MTIIVGPAIRVTCLGRVLSTAKLLKVENANRSRKVVINPSLKFLDNLLGKEEGPVSTVLSQMISHRPTGSGGRMSACL